MTEENAKSTAPVHAVVTFESPADAIEWAAEQVDDPCVDNMRFAFIDDEIAMNKYDAAKRNGCCGFFDEDVIVDGRPAMVGCNFGH
jgi:hypothetical protein